MEDWLRGSMGDYDKAQEELDTFADWAEEQKHTGKGAFEAMTEKKRLISIAEARIISHTVVVYSPEIIELFTSKVSTPLVLIGYYIRLQEEKREKEDAEVKRLLEK